MTSTFQAASKGQCFLAVAFLVDVLSIDHFYPHSWRDESSMRMQPCQNDLISNLHTCTTDDSDPSTEDFQPTVKGAHANREVKYFGGATFSPNNREVAHSAPKVITATERPPPRPGEQAHSPYPAPSEIKKSLAQGEKYLASKTLPQRLNEGEEGQVKTAADEYLDDPMESDGAQTGLYSASTPHFSEMNNDGQHAASFSSSPASRRHVTEEAYLMGDNTRSRSDNGEEQRSPYSENSAGPRLLWNEDQRAYYASDQDVQLSVSDRSSLRWPNPLAPWLMVSGLSYTEAAISAAFLLPHFHHAGARYLVTASSLLVPLLFNGAMVYHDVRKPLNLATGGTLVVPDYSRLPVNGDRQFLNTWFSAAGIHCLAITTLPMVGFLLLMTKLYPYQPPKPKLHQTWKGLTFLSVCSTFVMAALVLIIQHLLNSPAPSRRTTSRAT
jgi:hypothetical protein